MKKFIIVTGLIVFLGASLTPEGVSFAASKAPVKAVVRTISVKKVTKKAVKKVTKKKKKFTRKEPILAAPLLTPDPAFSSRL